MKLSFQQLCDVKQVLHETQCGRENESDTDQFDFKVQENAWLAIGALVTVVI